MENVDREMVKKKKEEETKEKPVEKKTIKEKKDAKVKVVKDVETFSISESLEKMNIKPLDAVGFLNFYGLSEDFKKEFETGKADSKFSEEEFSEMYKRYIEREI